MDKFVSGKQLLEQFDIPGSTLRRWANEGTIDVIRPTNGRRKYNIQQIKNHINYKPERKNIVYCRVSSSKQQPDLERQIEFMKEKYPGYEVITDVGSGLNWQRKGLRSILELALKGSVDTVCVAYKDRLCRFGFEFVEFVLQQVNTKLVVHNSSNNDCSETELSEDLISIVTCFVAKSNGKRSAKNRIARKEVEEQKIQEIEKESIEKSTT